MNQLHSEQKKEFQLERMILFSDAVFAIAITLLVIELKVPELEKSELSDGKLLSALGHMMPKFFGFGISFLFIGIYWTVHHRLFGYVVNLSPKLLRLNLLFLFAVALMPFSTAFYSEYLMQGLSRAEAKYFSFRALVVPAMFTLFAFIYLFNPFIASALPMLVPVVMRLIQMHHDKKNKIKIIKTAE